MTCVLHLLLEGYVAVARSCRKLTLLLLLLPVRLLLLLLLLLLRIRLLL